MARLILWFLVLTLGVAAFFYIATSRDVIDAWLEAYGLKLTDGSWFSAGVKIGLSLLAIVLVGAPLSLFLYSLAALGSDQAGRDIHGYTELRLKSGTKFMALICVGFLLFVFAMAFTESASLIGKTLSCLGGFFFLWAGIWLMRLRVKFDGSVVLAPDYFGRVHRHEWRDLERIEANKEAMEFHLWFIGGKRARVSFFLSGVDQLMLEAEEALHRYA